MSISSFLRKLRGQRRTHPPRPNARTIALAWLGCLGAVGLLAGWHSLSAHAILIAPFGASCALVFGFRDGPFSQPRHVLGGHLIGSLVGLIFLHSLGSAWWLIAFAVATAVALMLWLGVMHPPAGANPVIVLLTQPSWDFLLYPTLVGALLIVVTALIYHNVTPNTQPYPQYW